MRPLIHTLLIFGSVLFIAPTHTEAHSASTTELHIIEMRDDGFVPQTMTIEQGETVTFINKGTDAHWPATNIHPTHTLYPGTSIEKCGTSDEAGMFDSCRGLASGETFAFTFTTPGVWRFHDHVHAQFGGTITVTQGDTATTTSVSLTSRLQKFFQDTGNAFSSAFSSLWHWLTHWEFFASEETSKDIFNDDDALRAHLKKFGAVKTIAKLHELESEFGSCHQPAHRAGHMGYELFADKAFIEYSAYCQSGYYHGVMEQYLQENGTENLSASLSELCKSDLNAFFAHQCVHGIGHGIMAWTNYELPEALAQCDLLPQRKESCWTGVFMENLAAELAKNDTVQATTSVGSTDVHYTRYLSADPQYPCNAVDEKYKSSCYFLQTSRMLQLFNGDFKKVAQTCALVPEKYQMQCFGSMGRDVGGRYPTDMAMEIRQCAYVEDQERRIDCLDGAVQNAFWDPSGADLALSFCNMLTRDIEKLSCYQTIFERAPQVIVDRSERRDFCEKAEPAYRAACLERMK